MVFDRGGCMCLTRGIWPPAYLASPLCYISFLLKLFFLQSGENVSAQCPECKCWKTHLNLHLMRMHNYGKVEADEKGLISRNPEIVLNRKLPKPRVKRLRKPLRCPLTCRKLMTNMPRHLREVHGIDQEKEVLFTNNMFFFSFLIFLHRVTGV